MKKHIETLKLVSTDKLVSAIEYRKVIDYLFSLENKVIQLEQEKRHIQSDLDLARSHYDFSPFQQEIFHLKETIKSQNDQIEDLKRQVIELESRPLSGFIPSNVDDVSLSSIINQVVQKVNDQGKLTLLKKLIEDNIKLREDFKSL